MAKGYYKEVIKLLKKNGCSKVRNPASAHETWFSPATNLNFTVSTNLLSRHTANHILKEAGIDHKF